MQQKPNQEQKYVLTAKQPAHRLAKSKRTMSMAQ